MFHGAPSPLHHPTQSQEDVKKTTCLSFCIPMLDIFKQYSAHTSEIKIIICTPKMHIYYGYFFQKYVNLWTVLSFDKCFI